MAPGSQRRTPGTEAAPSSPHPQPSLTSCGRAPLLEGRLQFGQALQGGVGADALIVDHGDTSLSALVVTDRGGHRHNLGLETALALGSGCPASTVNSQAQVSMGLPSFLGSLPEASASCPALPSGTDMQAQAATCGVTLTSGGSAEGPLLPHLPWD